ncbi:MAG: hypothetical protein HC841_04240, partial [Verrucomicrobiae bacterium]|nr:hypothetical protein [Verrucomicrobiae bacterium]
MSGVAALSHQVIWTRRLVDLLGAAPDTFSKVIGAFFIGLALGSWLAAARLRTASASWWHVGGVEILVGLLSLPALFSYGVVDWFLIRGGDGEFSRILVAMLLVVPPAAAMGMVLPFMIGVLARAGNARATLWLYGWNTFGGVLGLALTLGITLPA